MLKGDKGSEGDGNVNQAPAPLGVVGGVGRLHVDSSENQEAEEEGEILAGGAGGDGGAAVGEE